MKITLIGTGTRVLRDDAAAAAGVDFLERLEAHKKVLRYFKTGDSTRRSRNALHPFG
jgi:uncharacterized protein YgbK (DUF1537 family)